jgi:hypothetical protein
VTVSIGLTDAMQDTAEAVLRRADMALYQAKRGGRNRVVLADKRDGDPAAATPDDADGAQTRDGARTVTAVALVDAAMLASHAEVATTTLAD